MSGGLSAGVAILKASWASLKMSEEEWMFFWMASSTVRNLSMSPADGRETPPVDTRVGGGEQVSKGRLVLPCGVTFSGGEHGGGQLTLLRLQVSQREPARVPARNDGDAVVRVTHISGAR